MATWRYIPFGTFTGSENMAIDEFLLNEVSNNRCPNTIRFYKWNPSTASIGYHQSLSAEIDQAAAKELGVDIVRRISGGGAVFHDNVGEITYAVICHQEDLPRKIDSLRKYDDSIPIRYQIILEALASGLESIGIPIDAGKIHCPALLTSGKKISGNAQAIRGGTLLQHGTILLTVNPELMYTILHAPEGTNYTNMIKSVRAKVTGILQEPIQSITLKENLTDETIVSALKNGFKEIFCLEFNEESFSYSEWDSITLLANQKYSTQTWLMKYP